MKKFNTSISDILNTQVYIKTYLKCLKSDLKTLNY